MAQRSRVLVVGGYGVFGSRIVRRLIELDGCEILVAGRSIKTAQAFCAQHGGTPIGPDAGEVFDDRLFAVIDAAGPFQAYRDNPYRRARAAIAAGAHYLDLADDARFVAAIGTLDGDARAAGVAVVSGCSSVPAISAAAVKALSTGLSRIETIASAICPGNRAPRGRSVIEAILAQVGKPLRVWREGAWQSEIGWGQLSSVDFGDVGAAHLGRRWASPIGAPDLELFVKRFGARTVTFEAGLELSIMHVGLWGLSWPVRVGILPSAVPLAGPLEVIANWLYPFGTDRGGMIVRVVGLTAGGEATERRWTLIAEAGDGPEVPPTPAVLMIEKLRAGRIEPGARPCVDELDLAEIEAGLARFRIRTGVT